MGYGDFKDLKRRKIAGKVLRDIWWIQNMMDINVFLLQLSINFFLTVSLVDKSTFGGTAKNLKLKNFY